MITLFGATGFTGRRVAHVLDAAKAPFRIAGRSPEKLARLAASLTSRPEHVVADARAPDSLGPLFRDTRVLINCAGPFTDLGEPVVQRAATSGVHYVDITNELGYVYRLRQYAALARKTGAALVPACAFEVAIADGVIDQLARASSGEIDSVDIVYALPGGVVSYGTRLSGLRTFATSWLAYRDGQWVGRTPGREVRRGRLNGRPYRALSFPSAEVVTIPAHCRVRHVQAWLAVSSRWAPLIAALMPLIGAGLRTPLGWLTALSFRYLAPPPSETAGAGSRFAIQIEIKSAAGERTATVRGLDPYGLTARIAAHAAQMMHAPEFDRAGLLAPSQALDSEAFVAWLTAQGVTVTVA